MAGRQNLWVAGLSLFLLLAMASLGSVVRAAEQYPVKPITFIVPSEAGSDQDVLARPLSQKISAILGQPVVIVNKPGAGSSIGFREVYASKPDGYTIGAAASPIIINKLAGLMPYDYHDYTVMGKYAIIVPVIVSSTKTQRPFKNIEETISFAKSHPGDVSIATSNVGGGWWVATMAFQEATKIKFNIIPQAGTGALSTAQVAGGHTDLGVMALASAKSQAEAGNIRILAVIGPKRAPGYENVPTLKEAGYDASIESPQIVIGPSKIAKDISDKLAKAIETVANEPGYQKFIIERGAIPLFQSPDKALQSLDEQRDIFRSVMGKAGILKEK